MKTKEINQWIHILSREEASKVPEAVAVAEGASAISKDENLDSTEDEELPVDQDSSEDGLEDVVSN